MLTAMLPPSGEWYKIWLYLNLERGKTVNIKVLLVSFWSYNVGSSKERNTLNYTYHKPLASSVSRLDIQFSSAWLQQFVKNVTINVAIRVATLPLNKGILKVWRYLYLPFSRYIGRVETVIAHQLWLFFTNCCNQALENCMSSLPILLTRGLWEV